MKPWISFEAYYQKNGAQYYGPGLWWLEFPETYTVDQLEAFKGKVFRYALEERRRELTPILTYKG